jgi:nucleoid-associated protein YgaU
MDQLETLKAKYAPALQAITAKGVHLTNLHVQNNKLTIKGAAPSEQAKNEVWTAVKAVDPTFGDLSMDLTVDPSLPAPAAAQTYTVVAGDTLSKISKHFLGNANDYMKIFEANKDQLKDPNMIKPGQVLKIPTA